MATTRAELKRPRRRDKEVLQAATKVFHERGYADATVQDVADELGILKGSLYYYIKTKEDLLFWLLKEAHESVELILDAAAARKDLDPLDRLALYVRGQVEFNAANVARVTIYYQDAGQLSGPRRREIYGRRRSHEVWVADMIRLAQESGEVDPDVSPETLANCLFGTMIWFHRWYRPGGAVDRDQTLDLVTRYTLAGITGAAGVELPPG